MRLPSKVWFSIGALNGALAVGFGAFGAHGLQNKIGEAELSAFQTGAQYHMYHALALLGVGWLLTKVPASRMGQITGWAFLLGILLFSGSLYVLGITGSRAFVLFTPIGGVLFLYGWISLALAARQIPSD